jgi:hypothetical protein
MHTVCSLCPQVTQEIRTIEEEMLIALSNQTTAEKSTCGWMDGGLAPRLMTGPATCLTRHQQLRCCQLSTREEVLLSALLPT